MVGQWHREKLSFHGLMKFFLVVWNWCHNREWGQWRSAFQAPPRLCSLDFYSQTGRFQEVSTSALQRCSFSYKTILVCAKDWCPMSRDWPVDLAQMTECAYNENVVPWWSWDGTTYSSLLIDPCPYKVHICHVKWHKVPNTKWTLPHLQGLGHTDISTRNICLFSPVLFCLDRTYSKRQLRSLLWEAGLTSHSTRECTLFTPSALQNTLVSVVAFYMVTSQLTV
jgi:hypothetical protein